MLVRLTMCWSFNRWITRDDHSPGARQFGDVLRSRSKQRAADCFTMGIVSLKLNHKLVNAAKTTDHTTKTNTLQSSQMIYLMRTRFDKRKHESQLVILSFHWNIKPSLLLTVKREVLEFLEQRHRPSLVSQCLRCNEEPGWHGLDSAKRCRSVRQ